MDRIKSITFNKEAQDNLPQHIKDKMKADRDNARKKTKGKGLNIPIVTNNENDSEVAFCDSPIHDFDRCPFIKQRNDCKSCRYYN